LQIPRTLVTNNPQRVRDLFQELHGNMVAKMLTPMTTTMDRPSTFVYTSEVDSAALDHVSALRHSPMVFQERVEKACELRVAYVDGNCFVGGLDASASSEGRTDWRKCEAQECQWWQDALPESCVHAVRAMMVELGLRYGALDFIRTPAGGHVFLEVNPTGEWGMLQRDLGLPIAEAISGALLA